jgi:hypothetical protein
LSSGRAGERDEQVHQAGPHALAQGLHLGRRRAVEQRGRLALLAVAQDGWAAATASAAAGSAQGHEALVHLGQRDVEHQLASLSISTSDSSDSTSSTWWVEISTLRSPSHHSSISIS